MDERDFKKQADLEPPLPLETPGEGVYETYANILDADWSLTDVTFRFMQLTFASTGEEPTTKNRQMVVLEKANITVPWWQAKAAAIMLTGLVNAYESINGELKRPELAVLQNPTQK